MFSHRRQWRIDLNSTVVTTEDCEMQERKAGNMNLNSTVVTTEVHK